MAILAALMPTTVSRYTRVLTWVTLAVQIGIVVTGGAVRLTASGLGCPQWPTCDGTSIVTTPEMGIHGLIEFGNRLLTFLLALVAIAMFLAVVRVRPKRRDLFWLALTIGLGIPAQAVIGGISVLVKLNPYVVGLHFVVSIAMVCLSTILVEQTHPLSAKTQIRHVSGGTALALTVAVFQGITIIIGILTTGSGPHSGDAHAPRNGLDTYLLERWHSIPAYIALALTVIFLVLAVAQRNRQIAIPVLLLLVVNLAQAAVGIAQSRLGLPVLLVGTHMLLACLVAATTTHVVYRVRLTRASA